MDEALRKAIAAAGYDPDEFTFDEHLEEWVCQGEDADGVPSWNIGQGDWTVTREIGWYVQRGDASDPDEVGILMTAMDCADRALSKSLQESAERRGSP